MSACGISFFRFSKFGHDDTAVGAEIDTDLAFLEFEPSEHVLDGFWTVFFERRHNGANIFDIGFPLVGFLRQDEADDDGIVATCQYHLGIKRVMGKFREALGR